MGGISGPKLMVAMAALAFATVVMLPEVEAVRFLVGGSNGWSPNVNYTVWAQDKHFYNGDWLFFVYDRNQMNVLEVNKTDYEKCNSDHPVHSWTTGAGRDVVPLNVTRRYYFISGKGFCFSGMKLAIHVHNPPPPPMLAPEKSHSQPITSIYTASHLLLPPLLAIGAIWEALIYTLLNCEDFNFF